MLEVATPHGRQKVTTLRFESIETPHAVSTRLGGISAGAYEWTNVGEVDLSVSRNSVANRKLVCASAKLEGRHFAFMEQIHGAEIAVVETSRERDMDNAIPKPGVDAMICRTPDVTLMATSADCPLVLLYDPEIPAIGVIHSGWRGTFADIVGNTVKRMQDEFKCNPLDILAGISPCICMDHFEVESALATKFKDKFPELPLDDCIRDGREGKVNLDLALIIRLQLKRAGVTQIESAYICTYEREDQFYSYRRDQGETGRFGLFAQLR